MVNREFVVGIILTKNPGSPTSSIAATQIIFAYLGEKKKKKKRGKILYSWCVYKAQNKPTIFVQSKFARLGVAVK